MRRISTVVMLVVFILTGAEAFGQFGLENYNNEQSWTLNPRAHEAVGSANIAYADRYLPLADYILWLGDELELTESQREQLVKRRLQDTIDQNEYQAQYNIYMRELTDLLEKDEVDMEAVEEKVHQIEELRANHFLERLESSKEATEVLNEQQSQQFHDLNRAYERGYSTSRDSGMNYPSRSRRLRDQ